MQKRLRPIPTIVLVLGVGAATLAGCTGRSSSPARIGDPPAGPSADVVTTAPGPAPPTYRSPTRSPRTDTPRTRPVDRAPTAADSLAEFFTAARADDARIRAAARAVNREIGPTSVHFSRATVDIVQASAPDRTARAIPAGMNADLLRTTLIVYADLATRSSALNPELDFIDIDGSRRLRTDRYVGIFLDGLHRGSLTARAYPTDLTAARALAAASPPIMPARPDSRAAAELAVRIAHIKGANSCDTGNPPVLRYLVPVVWTTTSTPRGRHDGSFGGIVFHATYAAGAGWTVGFDAC
jgi:hypothetical protein